MKEANRSGFRGSLKIIATRLRLAVDKWRKGGAARVERDLFDAVEVGDARGTRLGVLSGVSPDVRRADGVTPLALASTNGRLEVARTLLELGASPSYPTVEGYIPFDFARSRGDIEMEDLLLAAERGRDIEPSLPGTSRDLAQFVDEAELVLPRNGLAALRAEMVKVLGPVGAADAEKKLQAVDYRPWFEHLFASEALATAHFQLGDYLKMRSPMILGAFEVPSAKRRGRELTEVFAGNFTVTHEFLSNLLPDSLFSERPVRFCEIGGAWGATIKHLSDRFEVESYHNYEPDPYLARWTEERFQAIKMPVDGETLSGTADNSVDLAIANNVFVFVPPIKIWSYLTEMRRVIRRNGHIVFNLVLSDQLDEVRLKNYLDGFFPRRTLQMFPRDLLDRTFPSSHFEILPVIDKEYVIVRRIT